MDGLSVVHSVFNWSMKSPSALLLSPSCFFFLVSDTVRLVLCASLIASFIVSERAVKMAVRSAPVPSMFFHLSLFVNTRQQQNKRGNIFLIYSVDYRNFDMSPRILAVR